MQAVGSLGDVIVDDLPTMSLQAAKRLAKQHFTQWIDMRARANPRNLWHMYENGSAGEPGSRLWNIVFHNRGHSGGVAAAASIKYRENKVPVPRPDKSRLGSVDGGGRSRNSKGQFATGGDARSAQHVFKYQARVLEEYLTTTASASRSSVMVWWSRHDQEWVYRTGPVVLRYEATHGQFTAAFNEYWAGVGVPAVEIPIKSTVERVLPKAAGEAIARSARYMASARPLTSLGYGMRGGRVIAFQITSKGKRGILDIERLMRGDFKQSRASEQTRRRLLEELDALGASQRFVE